MTIFFLSSVQWRVIIKSLKSNLFLPYENNIIKIWPFKNTKKKDLKEDSHLQKNIRMGKNKVIWNTYQYYCKNNQWNNILLKAFLIFMYKWRI